MNPRLPGPGLPHCPSLPPYPTPYPQQFLYTQFLGCVCVVPKDTCPFTVPHEHHCSLPIGWMVDLPPPPLTPPQVITQTGVSLVSCCKLTARWTCHHPTATPACMPLVHGSGPAQTGVMACPPQPVETSRTALVEGNPQPFPSPPQAEQDLFYLGKDLFPMTLPHHLVIG